MLWCFEHLFCKYAEKIFRKSVSSVKNCGLFCQVYFCGITKTMKEFENRRWTAQTNTKCVLLHDKKMSSPLRRTWLMEHFNRPIAIMINDVDSNVSHSRSVWLRNSIPTFKLVFSSLYYYESRVTPHLKSCDISRFHSLYVAGRFFYVEHGGAKFLRNVGMLNYLLHSVNPKRAESSATNFNSPLFYYKTCCLSAIAQKNTNESSLKDRVRMFQCGKAPLKWYENKARTSQWQHIGLRQVLPHGVPREPSVPGRKQYFGSKMSLIFKKLG